MEIIGQLHVPAVLSSGIEPQVLPVGQETGWAEEPVRKQVHILRHGNHKYIFVEYVAMYIQHTTYAAFVC
jgi:hypothetical protein